jgi:hypothetical protein
VVHADELPSGHAYRVVDEGGVALPLEIFAGLHLEGGGIEILVLVLSLIELLQEEGQPAHFVLRRHKLEAGEALRQAIPASTASTWRNTAFSYTGSECREIFDESLEFHELFHDHQRLKRVLTTIARAWIQLDGLLKPVFRKSKVFRSKILDEIQRLTTVISEPIALKLTGWTKAGFNYHIERVRHRCMDSAVQLCRRLHPRQLSVREVTKMTELLKGEAMKCWPVASIAWYAKRNGLVIASLSTWYKYSRRLGIVRETTRHKHKYEGLKSTAPNQYLSFEGSF